MIRAKELLGSLLRMEREAIAEISAAEGTGDLKAARAFQKNLAKIRTMIERAGANPNAAR